MIPAARPRPFVASIDRHDGQAPQLMLIEAGSARLALLRLVRLVHMQTQLQDQALHELTIVVTRRELYAPGRGLRGQDQA